MNTLVRFVSAAAVLGTALVFSGCVTQTQTSRVTRTKTVQAFTVVESSTEKELTSAQMDDLRQAVNNYLREQGMTGGGTYYVKVSFPAANPGEEPQWAVVRIGNYESPTYTLLAAYPGPDDYYPYEYYRTGGHSGYYPGYYGFSRWGYYDPFDYNYGGHYNRPVPPRDHTRPDKPDQKPDHPPGARTRWNTTPRNDSDRPRGNFPPRSANPERWTRERFDRNDGRTRNDSGERSSPPERNYTPPPERSYTPTPERSYSLPEPTRSDSSSPSNDANSRILRPEPLER